MPIRIAANAGFCMGVSRAVSQALEAVRQAKAEGLQAFSLGELIHNPAVVASLREQGLEPVDSPEAAAGGPLAVVRNGDIITLDVDAQTLNVELDDTELARRTAAWTPPPKRLDYGWLARYQRLATSANTGAILMPPVD